ncbi:MAG: hypothetical protein J5950_00135 [Clostridia bacterium]|nr:hypothetical protein [Clostridia bacterium]
MRKRKLVILAALAVAAIMLLCGCAEIEKGESNWTPAHGDPKVQTRPTATVDMLVAFGSYPNTVAPSSITNLFKNIKIDDVTGLWVEEETETRDADGNITSVTVAKYDLQTGYYVAEETKNEVTTTTYYAKEGNKYYLVQEIQWIVLKDMGDSYLMISREILDAKPFSDYYAEVQWEGSTLRDWLNGTDDYARGGEKFVESWNFIDRAFTETEIGALKTVTNTTAGNETFGTEGGADTQDLIYLFAVSELGEYFGADLSMQAATTPFAAKRGVAAEYKTRYGSWWLRSPGIATYFQGIDRNGDIDEGGYNASDVTVGVRPVIVVAKSAVKTIDETLPTAGPIETPTPRPTARPTDEPEG